LIVGGGSAGHPPAGLCCFAGQGSDEGTSLMMPRHRLKNIINTFHEVIHVRKESSSKFPFESDQSINISPSPLSVDIG